MLMSATRGAIVFVAATGAVVALAQRPGSPSPGRDWTVSQRVDDNRVVVLFGGGEMYVPQREVDAATLKTRTRAPGPLLALTEERSRAIVGDAARVGDRWILDAGRGRRFHFTVERFVLGYKDCGEAWGVLLTVAADESARFATVSENYFVARLERETDAVAPVTTIGPIAFTLDAARRAELSALLERERVRTWPGVRAEAESFYNHSTNRAAAWAARWRALDAALDRRDATISYDIQAFRLTADGEPRLFVRARWAVGHTLVYALRAWVRVSKALGLDDSDVIAARRMRMNVFQDVPFSNEHIGLVLNVVDTDNDGNGEVLFMVVGYESRSIDVVPYPAGPGQPSKPLFTYSDGC